MEKVAIYARISTDNLGQDVDRQLHEVRDYCQRMGYEIAEELRWSHIVGQLGGEVKVYSAC